MFQKVSEEEGHLLNNKNRIWSGYIHPFENEIFSSWLMRLCQSHDIKSHSFAKFYFENIHIWNRDIDLHYPESLIFNIQENSPLNFQKIKDLFLTSYNEVIYNSNPAGFINTLGIFHRKRKNFGMLFCPGCLSEENKFYRKNWRLFSSVVCTKCGLNLQDRCPNCESPVCFHRLETGNKFSILKDSLDICYNCKKSICQIFIPASSENLNYQKYVEATILNGYNDKAEYSFSYFQVLHLFQTRIYTKSIAWMRVKYAIEREFSHKLNNKTWFSNFNDLDQRRESLYITYYLLESWPNRFIDFYNKYNLNYSEFSKDKNLPFWFTDVLKKN